jgi:hypothetical protein
MLDKITELKAKGYDLIAQLEAVQKQLAEVNQQIQEEHNRLVLQSQTTNVELDQ